MLFQKHFRLKYFFQSNIMLEPEGVNNQQISTKSPLSISGQQCTTIRTISCIYPVWVDIVQGVLVIGFYNSKHTKNKQNKDRRQP